MKKNGIVSDFWVCKANICFRIMFFGCNLSNVNPLKGVPMTNQECTVRPEIININNN